MLKLAVLPHTGCRLRNAYVTGMGSLLCARPSRPGRWVGILSVRVQLPCFAPCSHLRGRGQVADVLAVDVAAAMLATLCAAHGCAGPLGNEPGVRTWLGDVESVPAYQARSGRL